jgi:hypothetical protein
MLIPLSIHITTAPRRAGLQGGDIYMFKLNIARLALNWRELTSRA